MTLKEARQYHAAIDAVLKARTGRKGWSEKFEAALEREREVRAQLGTEAARTAVRKFESVLLPRCHVELGLQALLPLGWNHPREALEIGMDLLRAAVDAQRFNDGFVIAERVRNLMVTCWAPAPENSLQPEAAQPGGGRAA